MEKITGKLGSKLIILALLFLMPENLFAKPKSAAIKYSEYGVFWDFEDQFFEDFDINEPWTGDKIFEFDKTFRLCKKIQITQKYQLRISKQHFRMMYYN